MTDEERYLFDLNGYLVVENAIAPEVVAEMNAYIDRRAERDPLWAGSQEVRGPGNLLTWGAAFRNLLDNPNVLPYLKELLSAEMRLDHDYALFLAQNSKPLQLHGGGTPYDPAQYYHTYHGKMYNGLTVAVYNLTDCPEGRGGFACIPGSHKSNFPCPAEIRRYQRHTEMVRHIPCKAGDCILFTEALTHGTMPWQNPWARRALFFKYSPKHLSWAKRYYLPTEGKPEIAALYEELTEAQRALLQPPSVHDFQRIP